LADLKTTLTKDNGVLVLASFKRPEMVILGFWEKRKMGRKKSAQKSGLNLNMYAGFVLNNKGKLREIS